MRNRLTVVQGHDHPLLLSRALTAGDASWIGEPPRPGKVYGAKTRYRQSDAAARVVQTARGGAASTDVAWAGAVSAGAASVGAASVGAASADNGAGHFRAEFETPQWAVTPGQSAVFYDGDVCLGGGVIRAAEPLEAVAAAGWQAIS